MVNYGKAFEQKIREDFQKLEGVSILRLPDQWNGYKNSSNISDFVIYKYPILFYLEAKCRYKNTFNINDLTQYDKLLSQSNIQGVFPIVLIWFIDHDKVIAFPIKSIEKMKKDGLKSIHIDKYHEYPHVEVPSIKKRVFMDSDYNFLYNWCKENINGIK